MTIHDKVAALRADVDELKRWRASLTQPMPIPPDTNPTLEPHAPVELTNGQKLVLRGTPTKPIRIVADYNGIHGNDGVTCELDLQDVEIITKFGATPQPEGHSTYGIFANPCTSARLINVTIMAAGYALRGRFDLWFSRDCIFESNDQNFRLWKTDNLVSRSDIFRGRGRMILGGSAGGPNDPDEEFHGADFIESKIHYSSLQLGRNTHDVSFNGCDFTGCAQIVAWDGSHDLTFEGCTKDGRALNWGDFKDSASLEADKMLRKLELTP